MFPRFRSALGITFAAVVSVTLPLPLRAQNVSSVRNVQVLGGGSQVEIDIESSAPIVPQTNELGGPDRLLVDFVNAKPSAQLRNQAINRAQVKDLRVGLFSADPPVTRIVLDLNGPQPYQVFPSGRTTIVKIGKVPGQSALSNPAAQPVLTPASYGTQEADVAPAENAAPPPPRPSLAVSFQNEMLSIHADRATLSEVLFAVHQRTGAEIGIPAGAEQEKVAVDLGPAPAAEVLEELLNGSRFNFLILSSPNDPRILNQVILSPRAEGPMPVQTAIAQPTQPTTSQGDEQADQPGQVGRRMLSPRRADNPAADGEIEAPPSVNDGTTN
jgi:AMIN domain